MEGRDASRWVLVTTLALSILAHGPVVAARLPPEKSAQILASDLVSAATPRVEGHWKRIDPAPPEQIAAAREKLVAEARAARRRGELELGAFLLTAAELDAAELGVALDIDEAERRYRRGLAAFRTQIERRSIREALRAAHGDMHYQSIGGNMADALLEGGGSCEQLSHLVAATLHDGGYADRTFIRYYGGGTPHLAPIYSYFGRDYDLVSGGPALPGGVQLPAADLIEVYARKHGLADGPVDTGEPPRWSDGRSSFAGGYPPNDDAFGGVVPLFAEDAFGRGVVASPTDALPGDGDIVDRRCPLRWWDRLGASTLGVLSSTEAPYVVELIDVDSWKARYLATGIARLESGDGHKQGRIERVIHHACLTLAYERLGVDLLLLGKPALAKTAQERSLASRERVAELATPVFTEAERKELINHDDSWVLTVLPDPLVLLPELFAETNYGTWQLSLALLDHDATRQAMLDEIARRPIMDRLGGIMVGDMHGGTRWDDVVPADTDLGRARRAFKALVQRMGEGDKTLTTADAFVDALVAEGFPEPWAAELRDFQRRLEKLRKTEPDLSAEELNRRLRQ